MRSRAVGTLKLGAISGDGVSGAGPGAAHPARIATLRQAIEVRMDGLRNGAVMISDGRSCRNLPSRSRRRPSTLG
jgi:hypothetical protein